MMMTEQQFCLKWNNFHSSMSEVFHNMLDSESMVDVTLACEGASLKAHKMMLAACSPFFQSLFMSNPCKHPIVILKDVKFTDLRAIIEFMYSGEVNVTQSQLNSLLRTAENLKIKGLTEVAQKQRDMGPEAAAEGSSRKRRRKRKNKDSQNTVGEDDVGGISSEESDASMNEPSQEQNQLEEKAEKAPLAKPISSLASAGNSGVKSIPLETSVTSNPIGVDDDSLISSDQLVYRPEESALFESSDSNTSTPGPSTRRSSARLTPNTDHKTNLRRMRIEKVQAMSGGLSGRKMWSEEETRTLVKIWEEETARVWASAGKKVLSLTRVCDLLKNENIDRDLSQVEGKIKALKRDFKAIKSNRAIPAVQARMAPYLDVLESIFSREEL